MIARESSVARIGHEETGDESRYDRDMAYIQERLAFNWIENNGELYRDIIDLLPDHLWVKDLNSCFVLANRAVAYDLHTQPSQLVGRTDFDFFPREIAEKYLAVEQEILRTGCPSIDNEEITINQDGTKKWFLSSKVPLRGRNGEIVGLVGISRNVTARKQAEDEVRFLAHHDPLTRLPNRTVLAEKLREALAHADQCNVAAAIAYIDLDNFKEINDTLGHDAGDLVLTAVAARMTESLGPNDTAIRLGGDEFVVVLSGNSSAPIETSATKLLNEIRKPITVGDQRIRVTCSIGLAIYPNCGADAEVLLKKADAAMYQAKRAGRNACWHSLN